MTSTIRRFRHLVAPAAGAVYLVLWIVAEAGRSGLADHVIVVSAFAVAIGLANWMPATALGMIVVVPVLQALHLLHRPTDTTWPEYLAIAIVVGIVGAGRSDLLRYVALPVIAVASAAAAWAMAVPTEADPDVWAQWVGTAGGTRSDLVTITLAIIGVCGVGWAVGVAIGATWRIGLARVRVVEAQRQTAVTTTELRAEQERARIARDVHDSLAHSLAVVVSQAQGAAAISVRDEHAARALRDIGEVSRSALGDVRALVERIQGAGEDARHGLEDVPGLVADMRELGMDAVFEQHGDPRAVLPDVGGSSAPDRAGEPDERAQAPGPDRVRSGRPRLARAGSRRRRDIDRCGAARRAGRIRLWCRGHARTCSSRRWVAACRERRRRPRMGRDGVAADGHHRGTCCGPRGGTMTAIRVAVVDDQRLFASGMRMLVDAQDDMTCVGTAADGAEALDLCAAERPDVLLLDLRMPVMNGIETLARLAASDGAASDTAASHAAASHAAASGAAATDRPRVIALTTIRRDDAVLAALRAGAAAFLTKDALPDVVTATIRDVHEGRPAPTEAEALDLLRAQGITVEANRRDEVLDALTAREREVFLLVAKGLSNAEIAASVFLSEATVKTHVRSVLMKLGLRNRIQVVITAHERGLVRA
ncbi:response regulator [Curtobacterium sp. L3-7]|uniref:response regulator n=1 Tax=Curtobacterium sp. L3-7 TaxID=3138787 RepID=UPI003B5256B7